MDTEKRIHVGHCDYDSIALLDCEEMYRNEGIAIEMDGDDKRNERRKRS